MSEMFGPGLPGGNTVNTVYTADVGQYTATMGEAIATTEQYAKVADGAVGTVAKLGVALTRLATNGANGNRSLMSPAIQEAAAYEQQLSSLQARSVAMGTSFGRMGEQVRQMARAMPVGMGGAVQQFEALSRMGVTADKNIAGVAASVTKLGAATGEMGPGLTQQMVQFQRTFSMMDPKEFDRVGDAVTSVTAKMGASATGTLAFANQVAPLADMVGMTQNQLLGFSAAFDRVGVDGARGANVFTRVVSDLERSVRDGTPGLETYADVVGKTSAQFEKMFKNNPAEAMTQVIESLAKGGRDSIRTLNMLGFDGVRDVRTLTAIAQGGGIREAITEAQNASGSGSMAQAAETSFSGLNDQLTKTNESMRQMVEASGRPAIGMLTSMAGAGEKVASTFAGLVSSDAFQALATAGLIGRAALGTAGTLFGGAATFGQFGGMAANMGGKQAFSFINNNRKPIMLGGLTALAAGQAFDSPMMALAGGAAMLSLLPGGTMTTGKKAMGKLINFGYSDAFDATNKSLFGGIGNKEAVKVNADKIRELAGKVGFDPDLIDDDIFRKNIGASRNAQGEFAKITNDYNKNLKALNNQNLSAAELGKQKKLLEEKAQKQMAGVLDAADDLNPTRLAGGRAAGNYATLLRNIGMRAGAAAISPVGLAVGAAVAGTYGLMEWNNARTANDERGLDPTNSYQLRLADQMGVALKPIEDFTGGIGSAVKPVKDFADAVKVTAAEMSAQQSVGRRIEMPTGMNTRELTDWLTVTAGTQSSQYIGALLESIAATTGDRAQANEVGRRFANENRRNDLDAISAALWRNAPSNTAEGDYVLNTDTGGIGQAIDYASRLFSTGYGGDDAFRTSFRDFGRTSMTKASDAGQIIGGEQQSKVQQDAVRLGIEGYIKKFEGTSGGGDELALRGFLEAMKITGAKQDKLVEQTGRILDAQGDNVWGEALRSKGLSTIAGSLGFGVLGFLMNKDQPIGQNDPTPTVQDAVDAALKDYALTGKQEQSITQRWERSSDNLDRAAGRLLRWGADSNLTPDQVMEAIGNKQNTVENNDGQMVTIPKALQDRAITSQVMAVLQPNPDTGLQAGLARAFSGREGSSPANTIMRAFEQMAKGNMGDENPRMQQLLGQVAAGQMMLPAMTSGMSPVGAAMAKMQIFQPMAQRLVDGDLKPGTKAFSAGVDSVQQVMDATAQVQQVVAQQLQVQKQYQIQSLRMTEDHERQKLYAQQDYDRQVGYAQQDYQQQVRYAEEDFYLQRQYTLEDYHISVRRSDADFYRSRKREAEQWTLSMQRQAEDTAKGMLNPFDPIRPQPRMSFGQFAFNEQYQLDLLEEQRTIIDGLKRRGLSQKSVDVYNLADPSMLWQVQMFNALTPGEIKEMNRMSRERLREGKTRSESVDNVATRRQAEDREIRLGQEESDYERQRRRGADDLQRNLGRSETALKRSLTRMEEQYDKSMTRLKTNFDTSMARVNEGFDRAMARAAQDATEASKSIQVSFADALRLVGTDLKAAGPEWRKFNKSNMDGITVSTTSGWEDATGVHQSALEWAYEMYKALGIDGSKPSTWNKSTPTAHKKTTGRSSNGTSTTESDTAHLDKVDRDNARNFTLTPGVMTASSASASGDDTASSQWSPPVKNMSMTVGGSSSAASSTSSGSSASSSLTVPSWKNKATPGKPNIDAYDATVGTKAQANFDRFLTSVSEGTAGLPGYNRDAMSARMGPVGDLMTRTAYAGLLPNAKRAAHIVAGTWGKKLEDVGGWRQDAMPYHPGGQALDIMIPNYKTKKGVALGNQIAEYFMNTADKNAISYMIWRQRIWNAKTESPKPPSQWRGMGSRGGDTANHMDHIHLNIDPNAALRTGPPPGGASGGLMSKKEREKAKAKAMKKWDGSLWSLIDTQSPPSQGGRGANVPMGQWVWPMKQPVLEDDNFGEDRVSHIHAGEDMHDGRGGRGVYAVYRGVVTSARTDAGEGYGNNVTINHPNGYISQYAHLARFSVSTGDRVRTGQRIGTMGDSGSSGSYHLHFNLTKGGDPNNYEGNINPTEFLNSVGARKKFALGGVVTGPTNALIGEAGDREAVIPLNSKGVGVIADAIAKYSVTYEARQARTAQHAVIVRSGPTTITHDNSTQFSGEVIVKADDPLDFGRKMRAEARRRALISPRRSR